MYTALSTRYFANGVEVTLYSETPGGLPRMAEMSYGQDTDHIGLWFEGNTLVDYDGLPGELPEEVIFMLKDMGYDIGEGIL